MVFSFLNEENLSSKYNDAKEYTELLTKPFPEFDRIASNKPSDQRDPRYSDVTDGTAASVNRKTGKRVVQQIPTGKVTSDNDDDWLPIVAGFIFVNKILPYANLDYDFIQKCWQIIENGGKFGGVPTYVPFVNHDGYFCSDLSLPYWADVFIPRGYKSAYAVPYQFLRSWWQEEDIDDLIAQEKKLQKQARKRGEEYESTWDVKALQKIKGAYTKKQSKEQQPHEGDRGTNPEGIEIVTGFQIGVGATFYTFCPSKSDDTNDDDITIVRRKVSKDPRGKIPMPWFYYDADGSNPYGRGIIELIGPLQNLIDGDMAMYQWNRALMLAPPVFTYGVDRKKVVYAPNAVIASKDPNAKVEPLNIDTSAVINYPQLYQLQQGQLFNLVQSPQSQLSSTDTALGQGKTPTALKQQQATISVDDNYIRKNFEAWFENWGETAINIYFAERTGKEALQLDKDTIAELAKLAERGKFDYASKINENNEILMDYDTDTPALKFRVDASTSKMKDDVTQGEILTQLIQTVDQSPTFTQLIPPEKKLAAWNSIVANSGVEDPEDLKIDLEEFKKQQAAAAQAQAAQDAQNAQMTQTAQPTQPSSEDEQIIAQLQQMGVPDELIAQALQMLDNPNYTADDVITAIQGVMANG